MKKHDPETSAASYLAGVTSRRARRRFEAHILECEDCWREVRLGTSGRRVAESGRELAPQPLRERVRAAVSIASGPRIPWRRRLGLTALVALAISAATVAGFQLVGPEQPAVIQTLIGHFNGRAPGGEPATPTLPERLGDLELVAAERVPVDGKPIDAHRYRDPAGHEVVVYRGSLTFPMAVGARREGTVWEADAEGTILFCAEHPAPSLLAGDDRAEVRLAARLLGLS
ncbi:MAG: zf-HC2 domain-containing protein [Actinomycetota bacterium]